MAAKVTRRDLMKKIEATLRKYKVPLEADGEEDWYPPQFIKNASETIATHKMSDHAHALWQLAVLSLLKGIEDRARYEQKIRGNQELTPLNIHSGMKMPELADVFRHVVMPDVFRCRLKKAGGIKERPQIKNAEENANLDQWLRIYSNRSTIELMASLMIWFLQRLHDLASRAMDHCGEREIEEEHMLSAIGLLARVDQHASLLMESWTAPNNERASLMQIQWVVQARKIGQQPSLTTNKPR